MTHPQSVRDDALGEREAPIDDPSGNSVGELLADLREILGPNGCIESASDMAPYLIDNRERYIGRAPVVARPKSTEEVAAVVERATRAGYAVVPQGGNTGLVGGGVPDASERQILLSLGRMKGVRNVDPQNATMTIEAGVILSEVQRLAEETGLFFPLSLASEGSCQIGGNLATNAGGTAVLRYGNARDLVLGLEVVLANGDIWSSLQGLRKDNTGYDLKQLFLGSEGTLGIITAATLKLFPRPDQVETLLIATPSPRAAIDLLSRMRDQHGDAVSTFEYIHRNCLDLVIAHMEGARDPLSDEYEHYVLAELSVSSNPGLRAALEHTLEGAMEAGEVLDAVLAQSEMQRADLWRLRESIPEATKLAGAQMKHDVSVAVSDIPAFLEAGTNAIDNALPGQLLVAFGHVGDGNLHFNLGQTSSMEPAQFLEETERVAEVIHDLVVDMGGSFSAEHGIGQSKRAALAKYKSPVELTLMRSVKAALDPNNLLNPGKVI